MTNKTTSNVLWLIALIGVTPIARGEQSVRLASRNGSTTETVNPHWGETLCDVCHPKRNDGTLEPKQLRESTARATCDRCHTLASLSRALHHPYDIAPSRRVPSPPTWPLEDGRLTGRTGLTCLTCHDILRQCQIRPQERWKNRAFLRSDPKASAVEFCLHCHPKELYQATSPHDQIDDKGRERPGVCLYCHLKRPDISGSVSPSRTSFRSKITDLCGNCHGTFPHPIGIPHLVVVKREMLDRLCAYEIQDQFTIPLVRLQKYLAGENRLPRYLPVDGKTHEATCVTCHNPHEAGVFPAGSPQARGAEGDLAPNHRLRLPREDICLACHAM
jgi:hypothetical protein